MFNQTFDPILKKSTALIFFLTIHSWAIPASFTQVSA